jgi:hypothetical protein
VGNNAFLRALPTVTEDPTATRVMRESKNSIPVLWFALFEPGPSHLFSLGLDGGLYISVPALLSTTADARVRFRSRASFLRSLLPAALSPHIEQWQKRIDQVPEAYVALDPAELALLVPGDLEAWLREAPAAFDHPQHLPTLFDASGITFEPAASRVTSYDESLASVALTGYGQRAV